ncbi:cytoplasm to vacuole targeting vps64 [Pyrenophora seminiperda CCB06]|uniref:Cytoplasm to vacuole targeting vps64 n=1 Tax=Pyrenophora seminiperda CCB06 TaxID=1302712 RepID=A0A3M7MCN7_9PLEO|nr:cytoplasm to vacuole targeting vps64 [Pyrenophora seminiperda CCB06]
MTANINRQAWSAEGVPNGGGIFMPRKSAQRSNSSSSLSSQASTTSTISAASSSSSQPNGTAPTNGTDWAATRKAKTLKGLWPATKTEPIAGITAARPQPIASAGPGSSAASAMSALQAPSAMIPSQHNGALQAAQQQPNGAQRTQGQESTAVLHLVPMNGTFERKTITVPFFPDVLRIGRQTNNKTIPTPLNGYFDSKVLSRQHAEVWADRQGKIWIRDVKSSNGTFVNGSRLSQENRDSDPHELREQDMLELGIDIVSEDQKTIVHHKVAARVEHAGIYARSSSEMIDLNFGDMEGPQMSNMMGSTGQQQLANMRGRAPSQGSMNGQRMQGPGAMANYQNGMQQPRHPNFWLQPITMEQVVKKLNNEIKAAKQQSQDLQQTHQYINAILTTDTKEPIKTSPINQVKISPIKDNSLKARFSDPPAPPPQQPLPEKPDAPSSLRRSDTEREKTGSPVRSDPQLSSLTEALTNAKKEIESQGTRLRDLEMLLHEERRAREDAEERAARLERETNKDHGDAETVVGDTDAEEAEAAGPEHEELTGSENGSVPSDSTEDTTARLQQRLELMMSEMNEMKQQMERYRERAETAETDRKTLVEMIENIRKDNAKAESNGARRRSRSDSASEKESVPTDIKLGDGYESEEGEIMIIKEKELDEDGPEASGLGASRQNGHHVQHKDSKQSRNAESLVAQRLDRNPMYYGGPVGAIVTVVAIGVAVMAMLNQYPKAER